MPRVKMEATKQPGRLLDCLCEAPAPEPSVDETGYTSMECLNCNRSICAENKSEAVSMWNGAMRALP